MEIIKDLRRTVSQGDTTDWDHHILIIGHPDVTIPIVRYSRCKRDIDPKAAWLYYMSQVMDLGPGHQLIMVVEDLDHVHPKVCHEGIVFDSGFGAHMP